MAFHMNYITKPYLDGAITCESQRDQKEMFEKYIWVSKEMEPSHHQADIYAQ